MITQKQSSKIIPAAIGYLSSFATVPTFMLAYQLRNIEKSETLSAQDRSDMKLFRTGALAGHAIGLATICAKVYDSNVPTTDIYALGYLGLNVFTSALTLRPPTRHA